MKKEYLKYASYVVGAVTLILLVQSSPVHVLFLVGSAGLYFVSEKM